MTKQPTTKNLFGLDQAVANNLLASVVKETETVYPTIEVLDDTPVYEVFKEGDFIMPYIHPVNQAGTVVGQTRFGFQISVKAKGLNTNNFVIDNAKFNEPFKILAKRPDGYGTRWEASAEQLVGFILRSIVQALHEAENVTNLKEVVSVTATVTVERNKGVRMTWAPGQKLPANVAKKSSLPTPKKEYKSSGKGCGWVGA